MSGELPHRRLADAERRVESASEPLYPLLERPRPGPGDDPMLIFAYELQRLEARYCNGEPDIPGHNVPQRVKINAQNRARAAERGLHDWLQEGFLCLHSDDPRDHEKAVDMAKELTNTEVENDEHRG